MVPVRHGSHHVLTVALPASAALADDPEAIEAVLLHEFGHVFHLMAACTLSEFRGDACMRRRLAPSAGDDVITAPGFAANIARSPWV